MVTITITIGLPTGTCLLAANVERKAAQQAEIVINNVPIEALPLSISVSCADPAMKHRLAKYLTDYQAECARMGRMTGKSSRASSRG